MSGRDKEISLPSATFGRSIWQDNLWKYCFFLDVRLNNQPFNRQPRKGDRLTFFLSPHKLIRDDEKCFKEPRYSKGYEIPRCMIDEELTVESAETLDSTLKIVEKSKEVDYCQGLAYLLHMHFLVKEYTGAEKGYPSILVGLTQEEMRLASEDRKRWFGRPDKPIFKLERLLEFWNRHGAYYLPGIIRNDSGTAARIDYMTIPHPLSIVDDGKASKKQEKLKDELRSRLREGRLIKMFGHMLDEKSSVLQNRVALKGSRKKPITHFPIRPENWEDVTMVVYADDKVKISVLDKVSKNKVARIYDCGQIACRDERSSKREPNNQWNTFELLAQCKGRIDWDSVKSEHITVKVNYGLPKSIQILAKNLKILMGLDSRPFLPYKKGRRRDEKYQNKIAKDSAIYLRHGKKHAQHKDDTYESKFKIEYKPLPSDPDPEPQLRRLKREHLTDTAPEDAPDGSDYANGEDSIDKEVAELFEKAEREGKRSLGAEAGDQRFEREYGD